jgi:hypothetical protein
MSGGAAARVAAMSGAAEFPGTSRRISQTWPLAVAATAALLQSPGAPAQDASCKAVFNAIRLEARTPNHQYFTISGAEPDSHAQTNEMINTGSARFILVNGKWQSEPESPREMLKREEKNFKNSNTICRVLRGEVVEGAPATVFVEQSQTGPISSVGLIWIANGSGLPVREQIDTDAGTGPGGRRHLEIRIVYTGVQAPAVTRQP